MFDRLKRFTSLQTLFIASLISTLSIVMLVLILVSSAFVHDQVDHELEEAANMVFSSVQVSFRHFLSQGEVEILSQAIQFIRLDYHLAYMTVWIPGTGLIIPPASQGKLPARVQAGLPSFLQSGEEVLMDHGEIESEFWAFSRLNDEPNSPVIVLVFDRAGYMDSYNGLMTRYVTVIVGIVLLFGVFFLLFFQKGYMKPLHILQEATGKISRGDYSVQVDLHKPLEFELFAEIFNRMAREIESKERTVVDYSRELEQKFGERTVELKEAQKAMIQQEKMASLGQLAAGVAHEINNPVGYIMTNIKTLGEYVDVFHQLFFAYRDFCLFVRDAFPGNEKILELLQGIDHIAEENDIAFIEADVPSLLSDSLEGTRRISKIVSGLQSFAREDSEDQALVDLNEVVEASVEVAWNRLKYKAELRRELADVPHILGSRIKMEQVLINLLVNAADAIDDHGTVTVRSFASGDSVVLEVEDDGSGINADVLDNLFNPFFTTKEVGKGTGLGLSISKGIVEQHGGTIEVSSTIGKGSCFRITLPLKEEV